MKLDQECAVTTTAGDTPTTTTTNEPKSDDTPAVASPNTAATSTSKEHASSYPDTEEEEEDEEDNTGSLSVSSETSTAAASPETPLFHTIVTTTNKSSSNNSDNSNHKMADHNNSVEEASQPKPNNQAETTDSQQDPPLHMPSLLLNGPKYEQPLQLKMPHQQQQHQRPHQRVVASAADHQRKTSYLKDQFPSFDDMEEEHPLTVEDGSDHSSSQNESPSQLQSSAASSSSTTQDQHPMLRQRHVASLNKQNQHDQSKKLLSKLTIPQKAALSPKSSPISNKSGNNSSHHQKSNSILQEEMDYYPHPDDFPSMGPPFTDDPSVTNPTTTKATTKTTTSSLLFTPYYSVTRYLETMSRCIMRSPQQYDPTAAATWIGFWAMFLVTCANYVLMPMRDAIALAVGVQHIPKLTLASTVMAIFSSVPIGWLFEAPDPERRHLWKKIGLTRGETQGTSLALFYRFFALALWSYAIGFLGMEFLFGDDDGSNNSDHYNNKADFMSSVWIVATMKVVLQHIGQAMYIAFFLVVHLMKLHSLSLVWGVISEAMEYEETARKRLLAKQQQQQKQQRLYGGEHHDNGSNNNCQDPSAAKAPTSKTRLQRLAFVGFGGTVGGILGSVIASSLAHLLRLSGLLVVSALMLEAAAQLAIELGRIMHKHWMEQQLFPSTDDLASLDPSMKRSSSLGSMKRISSGNSLSRVKSMSELKTKQLGTSSTSSSLESLEQRQREVDQKLHEQQQLAEDTFSQRLLRGIRTILQSRLLMAIFTYNALYASTTTLLSFQRAELVANRKEEITNESNTAFLANINMASSVAVFTLQASGLGAFVAHKCGPRITLALMPLVRLLGVLTLAYWHHTSNGEPPNLLLFLLLDECCRVMNMAVAKPVRESLWRGLSNEARYEAKPIVDTLANRWGGGSAAFLVSSISRLLDLFGVPPAQNGEIRVVFGFPPVLFLCMIVAAWWAAVSADLGNIRTRIDMELKKMQ